MPRLSKSETPEPELRAKPSAHVKCIEADLQHELEQVRHNMAGGPNFPCIPIKAQLTGKGERTPIVEHGKIKDDQSKSRKIKGERC